MNISYFLIFTRNLGSLKIKSYSINYSNTYISHFCLYAVTRFQAFSSHFLVTNTCNWLIAFVRRHCMVLLVKSRIHSYTANCKFILTMACHPTPRKYQVAISFPKTSIFPRLPLITQCAKMHRRTCTGFL